ncbi:Hypothetical predicted protein, partial [Olea europaea subsp. europaea]
PFVTVPGARRRRRRRQSVPERAQRLSPFSRSIRCQFPEAPLTAHCLQPHPSFILGAQRRRLRLLKAVGTLIMEGFAEQFLSFPDVVAGRFEDTTGSNENDRYIEGGHDV